jgi:hypothetical protein
VYPKVSGLAAWSENRKIVQLSATRWSYIAILWVSLVSFAAITLCVASQRVYITVISFLTQSGNFWIHPQICQISFTLHLNFVTFVASSLHVWITVLSWHCSPTNFGSLPPYATERCVQVALWCYLNIN